MQFCGCGDVKILHTFETEIFEHHERFYIDVGLGYALILQVACTHAHDPSTFVDFSRVSRMLSKDTAEALRRDGYVVVDNFWGPEWASAFRYEMEWLDQQSLMLPNKTQFTDAEVPKPTPRSGIDRR